MSSSKVTTSKYVYRSTGGKGTDVSIEYHSDQAGSISRLEDKIRLLMEDLESERELRQRIERDKADLHVQVIQMSERLEEAEGGAESQFEINKKRDAELAKLRKLLEDVHLESEETTHMLRKKHQEAVADLQDQLEMAMKHKAKIEKDRNKLQAELYELLAQLESANKERGEARKTVEKLEVSVHQLNIKVEEYSRSITDLTSIKTRVTQENIELTREVQDLKVNIENVTYLKNQISTQYDDAKRKMEEDERRLKQVEILLRNAEVELESVRVQLEEEAEARLDLERLLGKANSDVQQWKSRYEAEAAGRAEEVEELRRKYTIKITELEEQLEAYMAKCTSLEKLKSRLQSEVEVLIIDLEKANGTARELQKRVDHLERLNGDLNSKLNELGGLYEQAQKDNRNKAIEIQRLNGELEKMREHNAQLTRDNKKLSDDNHDLKNQLHDLNRKYHDAEIECRRLENEREELASAYKESETQRKLEEHRANQLASELNQTRHDMEKRLHEKDEEIESIRKQMSIEIEALNVRLVDAETRLKTEVMRIKKKFQVTITELEMSLDIANKNNIELQKTVKKQSLQLTELNSHYEEAQRQLQVTLDQYGVAQRRISALQAELEEMRANLEAAIRAKRAAEQSAEESLSRVNELTTINVNISAAKSKLEQEYGALAADYDEINKELRLADDRAGKATSELKHTVEILHEEQERVLKIESIKKSLEIEVKTLSVRLEEVETNALVGGKRIISKLEARLRDMEMEIDEEKRRHAETTKILHKKDRHVKEVMIQGEEDRKNIMLLTEQLDKANEKMKMYKRQLCEQEGLSSNNLTRVRRFQRELESAEERAEAAETNLNVIRAKHRSFVTAIPGGTTTQTYVVEEHHVSGHN